MKPIRAAAAAVLCSSLLACTPPPPPKAPDPPAPPPVPVDGTYRGTSTRFQADGRHCPHPGVFMLGVWQGRFDYRWDYRTYVETVIDPDGTVHGEAPGITLRGKRTGKTIEGDVTNGSCGLHFTAVRRAS